ncbi:DNA-binding protein [Endozoicomonas sp. OPT23]|uniref:Zn-ribbon domain-containing OB-fold protein n=1 Tax=Endozoicomonas sp. OPT23 TaxID=2072845 RepID=UPI00129B2AD4|nr:OB-fold nucleic acid binding domain-containing protein [Endozoicomonas sp. OPT23]MRI33874.1 DNA-binding protein [Endozoicomonas sp. OPT23]
MSNSSPQDSPKAPEVLSQSYALGYTYTRSTGPVVGRFLSGLRDRKLVGNKGSDGKVYVPPMEYDPKTAEELTSFVDVAETGTVKTWSWVTEPHEKHLLDKPFAFALIQLDGSDVPMMHMVDAPRESIKSGMRVQVRWADKTEGLITDIACFEPETDSKKAKPAVDTEAGLITDIKSPVYLNYNFTAGASTSTFLSNLKKGQLTGGKCDECSAVYVPPRGSCAACGVATSESVNLSDKATIESFTIVHIPIPGNPIKPPFIVANIVLDETHQSFIHIVSGCDNDDVRIGMRVEAVWKPEEEWDIAMENITHFQPIDEPDVPREQIARLKPLTGGQNNE